MFNTDLSHSYAHFIVEIDEKSSLNGGFLYDFMMILNSGLFFGQPCKLGVHILLRWAH